VVDFTGMIILCSVFDDKLTALENTAGKIFAAKMFANQVFPTSEKI